MKAKRLLMYFAIAASCLFGSCSDSEEPEKDVSLIGKWVSYNHDELDEFATSVVFREAMGDFNVTFSEKGATFFIPGYSDAGGGVVKSTYKEASPNSGKYVFQQAFDEYGFKITASHEKGYLQVLIGNEDWDWWDKYDCSKSK